MSSFALITGRVRFAAGAIHRKKLVGAVLQGFFVIGHFIAEGCQELIGTIEGDVFVVLIHALARFAAPDGTPITRALAVLRIKGHCQ